MTANNARQDELDQFAKDNGHPPVAANVVCVDFDGTIRPWGGLFEFPEPLPGALEFLRNLKDQGYQVILFTSRLSAVWHIHEGRDPVEGIAAQVEYLRQYCERFGIEVEGATGEKIPSIRYYDDKAERFIGWDKATPPDDVIEQAEIAWSAGFFEGEGSIGVYTHNRKSPNNGGGKYGALSVSVSQIRREPLERLKKMFGGSIYLNAPHKPRAIHQWRLNSLEAQKFLTAIRPYLTSKTQEIELALEFISTLRPGGQGNVLRPLTEEEKRRRLEIIDKLKEVKRG